MRSEPSRQPVRTCVGCRQRFAQAALVRFVRRGERWERDAARVRAAGRGAYLCSERCAAQVAKNRRYAGLAPATEGIDWKGRPALCESVQAVYDSRVPPKVERLS
ncbi:MAG: YlxR family protein [Vulcanimicrobiaceae bacterium]